MNKPIIPSNNLPEQFAIEGIKTEFTADKIQNGYQAGVADIFGGGQLNYWLDTTGENITYLRTICDFITNLPTAKTITVDTNGELVYRDWLGGRNFGELVYSAIPLQDSSLKLLDGSVLTYTGVYKNFIDYIASIVNTYPSIFTTEGNWQGQVAQYGVCGKFVYNNTNKTVRLPKVTGIIEGTVDVNALGDIVAAGLPTLTTVSNGSHNHTATTSSNGSHNHTATTSSNGGHTHTRGTQEITGYMNIDTAGVSGAFSIKKYGEDYKNTTSSQTSYRDAEVNFNASRTWTGATSSNGVHTHTLTTATQNNHNHTLTTSSGGNHTHTINWGVKSNTIQPQTIKMFVYIVVSTSILKTDEVIDVDEIMSAINTKADADGANMIGSLSSGARSYFTGLALPSTVKTNIVIPTSGDTITAPSDGYICCSDNIKLTNVTRHLYGNYLTVVTSDIITVNYDTIDENSEIIFVYAQGGI